VKQYLNIDNLRGRTIWIRFNRSSSTFL